MTETVWMMVRKWVLAAILAAIHWGLWGYPLPTAEMELRRSERVQWMAMDGRLYCIEMAEEKRLLRPFLTLFRYI